MPRIRLKEFAQSSAPAAVGICAGDTARVANLAFEVEERLVMCAEAGNSGWWGSWAEMAFTVTRTGPHIVTPFNVARLESLAVCQRPVKIQNQFFETLDYGIGPQTANRCPQTLQAYERNTTPTFSDIVPPGKSVRVFTSASDAGKRCLLGCLNASGNMVYSQDGLDNVSGIYLEFGTPFVQAPFEISRVTSVMKDPTNDPVNFYEVDLSTGALRLILTMQPEETTANYRKYYFGGLPKNCCCDANNPSTTITITAMAKLEIVKANILSDWLLIQSLQAMVEEAESIRYSRMDNTAAQNMSLLKHKNAVRFLNGQITHYEGTSRPAVSFKPFGSNDLWKQRIGSLK